MKHVNDLQEIIDMVAVSSETKKDIVLPATDFWLKPDMDNNESLLTAGGNGLHVTDRAHKQLATITGIPASYYERLKTADSSMLAGNVNYWLKRSNKSHMVRTLDGKARAILSNSYKRMDNDKILAAALPVMQEQKADIFPLQSYITDDQLSIKFLHTGLESVIETKRGKEKIQPYVMLRNSETGLGYYQLQAGFYNGYCLNGCIFNMREISELSVKRMHKGSQLLDGVLSQETINLESDIIAGETRDILNFIFSEEGFTRMVNRLQAVSNGLEVNPESAQNAIKQIGQTYQLTQTERDQAYIDLLRDNDFTQWGVLNAVTKQANITDNNDRISHLETAGSKLLDLTEIQWKNLVNKIHAEPVKVLA